MPYNKTEEIAQLLKSFLGKTSHAIRFKEAAVELLKVKANRRPRTVAELKSVLNRMQRHDESLSQRLISEMDSEHCRELLESCFLSIRQREKARRILHSLFRLCVKRGWIWRNPIEALDALSIQEQEITPLSWSEIKSLVKLSQEAEHRDCMAALGCMLWAGVRPAELQRLRWEHVDWEEQVIVITAQHAKTGGCRHINMSPVLRTWLRRCEPHAHAHDKICPPDWGRRWKRLRVMAGLTPWRQDVLRHTFASYHLKKWHNLGQLQAEMGHRNLNLLRTRYLSMRGVTRNQADLFWRARGGII